MMGHEWRPLIIRLPMNEKFTRKSADRMALIPVKVTDEGFVSPVEFHGSAHISALCDAIGIIAMQVGKLVIEKGEIAGVRQI
jgi:molybdopterin molybdotransferase